jgi:hypothetical protein
MIYALGVLTFVVLVTFAFGWLLEESGEWFDRKRCDWSNRRNRRGKP